MNVKVGKNIFNVKTLVSPKEQRIGMMKKTFDESFNGMLFLMGGDEQCFWMKNCIIPLDIVIIKNNVVVNIHHNCPPCNDDDCPSYCGNGNIVLEVRGGTCKRVGIEAGDSVSYILS